MGAGWSYYHSSRAPRRKCKVCGKQHYLKLQGTFSNGEQVWMAGACPTKPEAPVDLTPNIATHGSVWQL